uniref:hypothetical protein n=1 Tax=Herbidospora sakaeratensis TaxID=564415 RepID=UPI0007817AFF|nr:hypothetical protein [Herbidospora sakaeratensis]
MAKFKNVSGVDVHVGRADGRIVKSGEFFEVAGERVEVEGVDDAVVIKTPDGDLRSWPTATWEYVPDVVPTPSRAARNSEES